MKSGIEEAKRFLTGKDFTWFERKNIRDESSLSVDDVRWLRGWTLAPIGIANIFYLGSPRRKLYDIVTVFIVTYLFFEVHDQFLRPMFINNSASSIADKYELGILAALTYFVFVAIPFTIAYFYALYFLLRHAKRLSWNRGNWASVEELRKTERKWIYFNTVPSLTLLVLLFGLIYFLT
ncbi:hypothetical protein HYW60_04060 [Candidatus Kaiserbacteria bacterium]|nr:hypothetical protein [Candidatus Kaiserbacteria bacterium]